MPRPGDIDHTYVDRLRDAGVELQESFRGTKQHHVLKCNGCNHTWSATPLFITQTNKRYGTNGCPSCAKLRSTNTKLSIRCANIQKLKDRGLEILSDWDGTTGAGRKSSPVPVTVRNTACGHTFTSTSKNLLTRGVECPECARTYKTNVLNADSERRSNVWKRTATDWQLYKSKVTKLTRIAYKLHKAAINPDNLPTGRAGTEGAYHLDHKVPIQYCFNHNIPEYVCAHPSNLQMLGWRENVGSRDKLKGVVPLIFEPYIPNVDKYVP